MTTLAELKAQAHHAIEEHLWMPPCTSPVLILDMILVMEGMANALENTTREFNYCMASTGPAHGLDDEVADEYVRSAFEVLAKYEDMK